MCAECHSTDLHKNYDAATKAYHTSFARIDVGCQACHGPASQHLAWAEQHRDKPSTAIEAGLEVDLAARDAGPQIETCARCHSRRAAFWSDYRYGAPLMDTHLPSLLEAPLYHPDGQILGEVYEYGSFLQSRMHAKGVRCSDCHEPHTAKVRAPGNALCATCHNASGAHARQSIDTAGLKHKDYDSPAHHFHATGKPGSQCVDCHMPPRTYMVIDPRRDHSLRIPRPDLSVKLGTPNACNSCHTDKPPAWAAERIVQWYGPTRRQEAHYGEILWAGRNGEPQADAKLSALARDADQPAIVRATALSLLERYLGQLANETFRDELSHSDPLIRRAALAGLEALPPRDRVAFARPLLVDPVRAVRIEAGRLLAPVAADLGEGGRAELDAALAEYVSAQRENADRPEGWLNLGNLYASQRQVTEAENAFRTAIALDPGFAPAYANLADLQRGQGAESAAEETLRAGLRSVMHDASLHHALGLALVRQRRYADGLDELKSAAKLASDQTRYAFVYGVALHDTGRQVQAMSVLTAALSRHPNDPDILGALASYAQQNGDAQAAERYARRLREVRGEPAR
jgi:predicted CXXCH cytochrome family protein